MRGCEPVWFIRHNGGSVWVDKLGWPWPKHECLYELVDDGIYNCVTLLAKSSDGIASPNLALLNSVSEIYSPQGPKLQIGCLDGSFVFVRGTPEKDYLQLLGELVIFSKETGLLRHSKYGNFQTFPLKAKKEWIQCKCKCWVEKKFLAGHLKAYRCDEVKVPVKTAHDSKYATPKIMLQMKIKSSKAEKKFHSGIQLVIRNAWLVADAKNNFEANFKLVKQEAIRLINALSPHIRREVNHYFTSRKWSPLLERNL